MNRQFLRRGCLQGLMLLCFILLYGPVKGQKITKQTVTELDYPLWNFLQKEEISYNGNWISYSKYYDSADSLFVQQRSSGKVYGFAHGDKGLFVREGHFICGTKDGKVYLLSLSNGEKKVLNNIKSFEVFGSLLIATRDPKQGNPLSIYNLAGKLVHSEKNFLEYVTSPDKMKIIISLKKNEMNVVQLLDVEHLTQGIQIVESTSGPFQRLTWSADGKALAFMRYGELESKLFYYELGKKVLRSFSTADTNTFPKTMNIATRRVLKFSDDNKMIFFRIRNRNSPNSAVVRNEVQVWNAADKYIYPTAKSVDGWSSIDKHALWEPETGRILLITDTKLPHGAAAGDKSYALTFNPKDYAPHNRDVGETDVYITHLSTGNRKLLLKKHIITPTNLLASPGGNYISYFSKGSWYIYNVANDSHSLIKSIPQDLTIVSEIEPEMEGYGSPGWTLQDKYMLIYDQFDIWMVSPDGSDTKRLTKGRENKVVYRIINEKINQNRLSESWVTTNGVFDLDDGLLLKARSLDHYYNGISVWDVKNGLKEICYTNKRISMVSRSKNNVFAWMEEDTDLPWQIKVKAARTNEVIIVKSNIHQDKFMWTKSEMVTYQNRKGETLKGILYYPAGYQVGKQYPMVVNIYEMQSNQAHYYRLPTLNNSDGFNVGNLTSKGYFVLLPDITYDVGSFGLSALNAVEAAVKTVLKNYNVDEKRVGLIGHSFGGSQTDYILTQSKMFACAVAGSATTNFLSSYLAVSETIGGPNFYKMEYGQARMQTSPYENMDRYLNNSPVIHASKVTTPLLSWTGLLDQQVLPTQSFEFYMALRRLGKIHVMLVYPNAGHDVSSSKEDAVDLTHRIEAWFGHYLKGETYPDWARPEHERYEK